MATLDLSNAGLTRLSAVHHNLPLSRLVERSIAAGDGMLSADGALVVATGKYTGRSPNDKFTVADDITRDTIWWGKFNLSMTAEAFDALHLRLTAYLQGREVYVQDCFAGADTDYRLAVRVITERPHHSLFARNMFIQPDDDQLAGFDPSFTIIQAPGFHAVPERDGTNSEAAICVDYTRRMVLICGSEYAGEIKKSIFTALNFLLPEQGVMGMHCSANVGRDGEVAVFFGLSGTGKTTLSADPNRSLIGDDEHGWAPAGVYNFEGGCYAKVIRLDREAEPEIFATTERFGTLLENVVIDPDTRVIDLQDGSLAENTRASYDISAIPNIQPGCRAGHPTNIIMLTADAFGVMPPLSRMTADQAMYHFISGYTAKVAGTERGVKEPQATFSACFGAPFMARHPTVYAKLLGQLISEHKVTCWLVNTGWSSGPYGVGSRMKIQWTRALLNAALSGALDDAEMVADPRFKVAVPTSVAGVPDEVLAPRNTWTDGAAYDAQADHLVTLFRENFAMFEDEATDGMKAAQPE